MSRGLGDVYKRQQYFFDPGTMTVTGYHSQNSFKMGQEVKVRVKKTNLFKRQIDFILED